MFHVLLIDDREEAAALARLMQQQSGRCHLHHVANRAEALDFLHVPPCRAGRPSTDLIILNLLLDDGAGVAFLSELKKSRDWSAVPVIALSDADPSLISQAYALQANCCIVSPSDLDGFATAFRSIERFWTTVAKLPSYA